MAQYDPAPTDPQTGPQEDVALAAAKAISAQERKALARVVERTMPWLVDLGNWIFAGLIATLLIVLAALITIGPVDPAITLAAAAFALALPLELAGLVLLRLLQDLTRMGFPEEWARAFQDAGFPVGEQVASPQAQASLRRRRTNVLLLYSLSILALTVLLTLIGLTAALWHLAWWIGGAFCAMAIISLGVVIAAFVTLGPPESPEQKARDRERNRRYWEEMLRRAREHPTAPRENA